MERSKLITIIAAVVIVLVFIGVALFMKQSPGTGLQGETSDTPSAESKTRAEVPFDAKVPEKDSADVPQNVAQPMIVGPSAPNAETNFRSFDIKIDKDSFSPDTVIVKRGDIVHINFSAIDKNYDFTQPDYGLSAQVAKGSGRIVEFQASAEGKFTFFCASCGGPEKGPVGYVIITNK